MSVTQRKNVELLLVNMPSQGGLVSQLGWSGKYISCCIHQFRIFVSLLMGLLHICHNHHNRWLCKKNKSSVKNFQWVRGRNCFDIARTKCGVLQQQQMCNFTLSVKFYTQSVVLHTDCNFTHRV